MESPSDRLISKSHAESLSAYHISLSFTQPIRAYEYDNSGVKYAAFSLNFVD